MKHLNIKIYGRVHGVGFRLSAKKKADGLDLTGIVRNEPGGAVFIEVEGPEDNLRNFLVWCENGPKYAKIEKVESAEGDVKNYKEFRIQT